MKPTGTPGPRELQRKHGLLLAAIVLLALCLQTAGAAEAKPGAAQLDLRLDAAGGVSVYLAVFVLPPDPAVLEGIVSAGMGAQLRHVTWDIEEHKRVVSMYAQSATGYPRTSLLVDGELAVRTMEEQLRRLDVNSFQIRLTHPASGLSEFSPPSTSRASGNVVEYLWQSQTGKETPRTLHFRYGYLPSDVARRSVPLAGVAFLTGAFLPVWTWLRRRQTNACFAQIHLIAAGQALIAWLAWGVVWFWMGLDQLSAFVLAVDSHPKRMGLLFGLLWLPPALLSAFNVWSAARAESNAEIPVAQRQTGRLVLELQAWLIPITMLLAGALSVRGDQEVPRAHAWLGAAFGFALVALIFFFWSNAESLTNAPREKAGWALHLGDAERKRHLRSWSAGLAASVVLPAIIIFAARQLALEETVRHLSLLAGLTVSTAGMVLAKRVWGLKDTLASKRNTAQTLAQIGVALLISLALAWLLEFPFDLSSGDEAWALVSITGISGIAGTILSRGAKGGAPAK